MNDHSVNENLDSLENLKGFAWLEKSYAHLDEVTLGRRRVMLTWMELCSVGGELCSLGWSYARSEKSYAHLDEVTLGRKRVMLTEVSFMLGSVVFLFLFLFPP